MIERLCAKFNNFMIKFFGANWRTTTSGILTVIAGFVLTTPEALEFLPNSIQHFLDLFSKIVMIVAGGSFALLTKDKRVTGGKEPCTSEAKKRVGL